MRFQSYPAFIKRKVSVMAESFSSPSAVRKAALKASLMGGAFFFIFTTDNVEVAKELGGTAVGVAKELGSTVVGVAKEIGGTAVGLAKELSGPAVKLGAIYAGYHLLRPLIDGAVKRAFGGERDDQNVEDINPGCSLHVLLRCFTDKRFLEVLADYESGRIKERLQIEFSRIGIKTEGLKVEVENMEEVNKIKAAINRRANSKDKKSVQDTTSHLMVGALSFIFMTGGVLTAGAIAFGVTKKLLNSGVLPEMRISVVRDSITVKDLAKTTATLGAIYLGYNMVKPLIERFEIALVLALLGAEKKDLGGGRKKDLGGGRKKDLGGGRKKDLGGGRKKDLGGGRKKDLCGAR